MSEPFKSYQITTNLIKIPPNSPFLEDEVIRIVHEFLAKRMRKLFEEESKRLEKLFLDGTGTAADNQKVES